MSNKQYQYNQELEKFGKELDSFFETNEIDGLDFLKRYAFVLGSCIKYQKGMSFSKIIDTDTAVKTLEELGLKYESGGFIHEEHGHVCTMCHVREYGLSEFVLEFFQEKLNISPMTVFLLAMMVRVRVQLT